ncbi:hypothetical protein EX30DRAFT_338744 [Ascodesmis nigricans]|uniref:Succinate dehydrogenase assembly factor 4, mitochondrial n=1 Tax=Ascodesmis nigricans TaxID=341454 RepID=A0A4V3SJJ0_9PEZI|nr:hypothetical protein EX30DRAFT_338744 [Ascodesmis nigricans]
MPLLDPSSSLSTKPHPDTMTSLPALRAGLRRTTPLPLTAPIVSSTTRALSSLPPSRPAPPRLPKEQQEEFERLQKASTGAFSTSQSATTTATGATEIDPEELHKDLRRGAKPEFEGEKNPKTGEIGGPKNDPLLHREWTFNGRATDF